MSDHDAVLACARDVAAAIGRRDEAALRDLLASDFVHRTPGGPTVTLEPFLTAIGQIPGEILSVSVDELNVDIAGDAGIVTGIQHARVKVDGAIIDDTRPFADWFVKESGRWRLRVAVEPRHEA
jgi:ketosteroid isomerase-like protein